MSSVGKNVWITYCFHILLVGVSTSVTFLGRNLLTIINFVITYTILMPEMYLRTHTHTHTGLRRFLPIVLSEPFILVHSLGGLVAGLLVWAFSDEFYFPQPFAPAK